MSLRVVNLDNRPFYTVVKQIIKKQKQQWERRNIRGWVCGRVEKYFHLHHHQQGGGARESVLDGKAMWKICFVYVREARVLSHSTPCLCLFFSREQHIEKICNGTIKSSGTFFFSPPRSTPDRPTLPIRWCVRSISRCPLKL